MSVFIEKLPFSQYTLEKPMIKLQFFKKFYFKWQWSKVVYKKRHQKKKKNKKDTGQKRYC